MVSAQTFIDATAPPEQRSTWLSLFFVSIPLGYALGFVVGGYTLSADVQK